MLMHSDSYRARSFFTKDNKEIREQIKNCIIAQHYKIFIGPCSKFNLSIISRHWFWPDYDFPLSLLNYTDSRNRRSFCLAHIYYLLSAYWNVLVGPVCFPVDIFHFLLFFHRWMTFAYLFNTGGNVNVIL